MNENQRINVDVNRRLWREVGIWCAENGVTKRTFMEEALAEKLDMHEALAEKPERDRDNPDKK